MRNRELATRRLEQIETTFFNLERIVNTQQPIEEYKKAIAKGLDYVEELKSMVEAEPMSPSEINRR